MDEYVIVEKSSLNNIADTVRTTTGSTENIAVSDLSNEVAAAVAGGNLSSGGAPYQQLVTDGDGNAKWEDRLAYETDPIISEVFPEQTLIDGRNIGGLYMFSISDFTIMPDLEYTAVFDDIEYKCRSVDSGDIAYIGNATILGAGMEDTGEPFVICRLGGRMYVVTTTDGPHTISLSVRSVVYHQLPLNYIENGKFLKGIIRHESRTMSRDDVERYGFILSATPIPMLIWGNFKIKSLYIDSSNGVNNIEFEDYDGYIYTIKENSDGLYSLDDIINGRRYMGINFGNISNSRIILRGREPVNIEGNTLTSGNALDYPTFRVKRTGPLNGQDFEVLGNGTVKAYSVILPSSTAGSTKKFKITVDDSGTISATEVTP